MNTTEFLRKADAALASAKRDLEAGDLDGAANRLYYAMFHAARAALLSIGAPAQGKAWDDYCSIRSTFLQGWSFTNRAWASNQRGARA